MNEDFLNDNVIIPEDIKTMSSDELKEAIRKLEQELKARKSKG